MQHDLEAIVCPVQRAATLVADVAVVIILRELQAGPRRFGELLAVGLNPRSLSDRLRRLTQEGVITRTRYAEAPPRVEYDLTTKGQALTPVLDALQSFGETWMPVPLSSPDQEATPARDRQQGRRPQKKRLPASLWGTQGD